MCHKHKRHIDQHEIKQHHTRIGINYPRKVQSDRRAGHRNQIHFQDLYQLLKRPAQKHLFIKILI